MLSFPKTKMFFYGPVGGSVTVEPLACLRTNHYDSLFGPLMLMTLERMLVS